METSEVVRRRGINRSTARRNLKFQVLLHYYGATPTYFNGKKHFKDRYVCYFCKGLFRFQRLTVEHLIPISRGGSVRDLRNLEVACSPCNHRKDSMTVEEFMAKYELPSYLFPRRGLKEEEV